MSIKLLHQDSNLLRLVLAGIEAQGVRNNSLNVYLENRSFSRALLMLVWKISS